MYDKILNARANKKTCNEDCTDWSKPFDTLNHNTLLEKLPVYGIQGVALSWFKYYFSLPQQYVVQNWFLSEYLALKCGVPQGSILYPSLFLLYNDITKASSLF